MMEPEARVNLTSRAPPAALQACVGATLTLLTLATALSNAFVIATIYRSRKLHTPANVLIASLAVTDLLVSVLVMPVCALYTATRTWSLGQVVCDLWLSSDITCCTASILHLCVIALDRYWAVTDAVEYARKRTAARAAGMIAGAWVIAVCISLPPFFWRQVRAEDAASCSVNTDHVFYTVYSTCGAFYLPTLLLLALYGRIYLEARRRIARRPGKRLTCARLTCARLRTDSPGSAASLTCGADDATSGRVKVTVSDALLERKRVSAARERRATQTLGVILGAYMVCWLPFFTYTLLVCVCESCDHPQLFDLFTWLGYLNSLVNPVIYTVFNEDFRRSFTSLSQHCCR